MNFELINQIKSNYQNKETDDLLSIWVQNDKNQLSDEAFEAIKQLLVERKVELHGQQVYNKSNLFQIPDDGEITIHSLDALQYKAFHKALKWKIVLRETSIYFVADVDDMSFCLKKNQLKNISFNRNINLVNKYIGFQFDYKGCSYSFVLSSDDTNKLKTWIGKELECQREERILLIQKTIKGIIFGFISGIIYGLLAVFIIGVSEKVMKALAIFGSFSRLEAGVIIGSIIGVSIGCLIGTNKYISILRIESSSKGGLTNQFDVALFGALIGILLGYKLDASLFCGTVGFLVGGSLWKLSK